MHRVRMLSIAKELTMQIKEILNFIKKIYIIIQVNVIGYFEKQTNNSTYI